MFDLKEAIANWRRQMIAGGIKSAEVLDELESHLREDIEKQMREGAPAEQAFAQAVEHVGRADELKLEFGKIERLRPTVSPKLIKTACAAMALFIVLTGVWQLLSDELIADRILVPHQISVGHAGIVLHREFRQTRALQAPISNRFIPNAMGFVWLILAGAYVATLPRLNRNILRGVRGWALRNAISITCTCFCVACVALLLLGCANIILLSSIPNVIFWPLFTAAVATVLVLVHGTDAKALGFWSPATQQCIELADQEALHYHHDFCGTEHVLLGLLEPEDTAVSKVLGNMGVSREAVRAEIEKIVVPGPVSKTSRALVGTPRAKKAFVLGLKEANSLRCERMEPPHLLLGLLREGSGVAAIVLKKLGVDLERARAEILKVCH